jgi:GT2 family glycosyltransferase
MAGISIVLGTYNRFTFLRECVLTIREFVSRDYEIIVADGGSTDGSREWMVDQNDIVMIGERALFGAVDAYNKAFSIAKYPFVAHLNDDCHLQDTCLDAACELLETNPLIGQVAIPFYDRKGKPRTMHIHMNGVSVLYANFGVTRKKIGDHVGWWGNYLHTYGGDCELSFQVWNLGFQVMQLRGYAIYHHREDDGLRRENRESRKFFDKWTFKVKKSWEIE